MVDLQVFCPSGDHAFVAVPLQSSLSGLSPATFNLPPSANLGPYLQMRFLVVVEALIAESLRNRLVELRLYYVGRQFRPSTQIWNHGISYFLKSAPLLKHLYQSCMVLSALSSEPRTESPAGDSSFSPFLHLGIHHVRSIHHYDLYLTSNNLKVFSLFSPRKSP